MDSENIVKTTAPTLATIREGDGYLKVGDVGSSVVTCRKLLDGKGYTCITTSTTYDSTLQGVVKKFQTAMGLTSDGYLGQATLAVLEDTQSDTGWFTAEGNINITAGKLARLGFVKLALKPANVTKLNEILNSYGFKTRTQVRHFLAQGMAECDKGNSFMEYGYTPGVGGSASYSPFYGAGFIQMTNGYTYEAFYQYMKDVKKVVAPKILNPDVYATQYVAENYPYECSGWFWNIYKNLNNLITGWTSLSASDTVKEITIKIKGSSAGYQTRLTYYEKAKEIFK